MQLHHREVGVGEHQRLGDLQHQRGRGQSGDFERLAHVRHERFRLQLPDGEIHAHRQRLGPGEALSEARSFATGRFEDPPPHRDDQARLRMIPTDESLDAENLSVGEPHDGLVVQLELIHGQRVLEV